jgi:hypothetical protein
MASSKSSAEVLAELREAARLRRAKPPPEPKHQRAPSQTILLLRTLKARARQDHEFAAELARVLGVYPPLAGEWCSGNRRPSPKRRRQIRQYLAVRTKEDPQ